MTMETFARARYGTMSVADLAVAFEQIVGEPPEKKNKLWMLKRMEQAHASRVAVERAVARARGGGDAHDSAETAATLETQVESAPVAAESSSPPAPPAAEVVAIEVAARAEAPVPEPAVGANASPPVATEAEASEVTAPTPATVEATTPGAGPEGVPSTTEAKARRRYVPVRFKNMSMEELHVLYLQTVGKPTKSVDIPYLAWKINLTERKGASTSSEPRRARRTSAGRGEAKAVTLREYPDTLAAVEGVCARHNFRNRLDFFRRAAQHFLQHLGERDAAAFFAEMAPSDAPTSAPSPS
jgi:hypothetical protein